MGEQSSARLAGDDYQHLYSWFELLQLLPADSPYSHGYVEHPHAGAAEVLDEIEDLDQKAAVEQAIAAGHFDEVKLDQPGELELFVNFNATLGKGESACLAVAKARGWVIADESKDPKWKKVIAAAGFTVINTPGILLAAIRAGALTIAAAAQIKERLEQRRFKMKFDSFGSLI